MDARRSQALRKLHRGENQRAAAGHTMRQQEQPERLVVAPRRVHRFDARPNSPGLRIPGPSYSEPYMTLWLGSAARPRCQQGASAQVKEA
jgi:hypothetical protein